MSIILRSTHVQAILVITFVILTEKSLSTCGNFIIDEGEECDEGSLGNFLAEGRDSCCTAECMLKERTNCRYDINQFLKLIILMCMV